MNPRSLLFIAVGLLGLWSCDASKTVAVGGGDETHSNIDIQGAVFTNRSEPFAGIVVKLRGLGIADTTDSRGAFRIHRADTTFVTKSGAVDTLDYLREGRIVHSQAVPSWVATLPDLFLVQRDISGKLTGAVDAVKSVEAIFGTDRSDTLALEWNPVLGSYSGFAYAPWDGTGTVTRYQVRIEVRDSLHHLIGRSFDIPFTSRAGDLDVPVFSAGNARPKLKLTGPDSAYSREWMPFTATATDSFGQSVTLRWEEAPESGRNPFVDPLTGAEYYQGPANTKVHIPMPSKTDSVFVVHCTATDEEGATTRDSVVVHRRYSPPYAQFTLSLNGDSVHLHMETSVKNKGRLLERRLFLGHEFETGWDIVCSDIRIDTINLDDYWSVPGAIVFSKPGWSERVYEQTQTTAPTSPNVVQSRCDDHLGWSYSQFMKRDSGVVISGRDTTFAIPPRESRSPQFQFAVQLLDEDGQIGVWRSVAFAKVSFPETLSLAIASGDTANGLSKKVHIGWVPGDSASIASQGAITDTSIFLEVTWKGTDTSPAVKKIVKAKITDSTTFDIPADQSGGCATIRRGTSIGYSNPITACTTETAIKN